MLPKYHTVIVVIVESASRPGLNVGSLRELAAASPSSNVLGDGQMGETWESSFCSELLASSSEGRRRRHRRQPQELKFGGGEGRGVLTPALAIRMAKQLGRRLPRQFPLFHGQDSGSSIRRIPRDDA